MKKSDLSFAAILVPIDYIMLIVAALTAYFLRYENWIQEIRPVVFNLNLHDYLGYVWWIALVWLFFFTMAGLYQISLNKKIFQEFGKIFLACSTGMLAVIVGSFFSRELFNSRFILLAAWIFSIIFILLGRLTVFVIRRIFYSKGLGVHKVVLIGDDDSTEDIAKEIYRNKKLGYRIIARYKDVSEKTINDLSQIEKSQHIDEIIQADSSLGQTENLKLLDFADRHHVGFKYAADLFTAQIPRVELSTLSGVPIVEVKRTPLDGWGKILKRIFDIILSVLLILIFSPIFIIISIIIKIDSRGPVFYASKRIGAQNRPIKIYKFRSMINDAEKLKAKLKQYNERNDGPLFKMENDPRVTKVGKFLRKWSLDELPQFFNVLNGQLSLVGPRPHEPHEVAQYEKKHIKLLNIKPGVTGMAQVSGRSDLKFEEEVKLDVFYIENWSLWLDIIILIKTPFAIIFRKGAK